MRPRIEGRVLPLVLQSRLGRFLVRQWAWGMMSPQKVWKTASLELQDFRQLVENCSVPDVTMQGLGAESLWRIERAGVMKGSSSNSRPEDDIEFEVVSNPPTDVLAVHPPTLPAFVPRIARDKRWKSVFSYTIMGPISLHTLHGSLEGVSNIESDIRYTGWGGGAPVGRRVEGGTGPPTFRDSRASS